MAAYYNEIDPYAAQWLRNLIKAGHIADGVVDERSIEDVHPNELAEFTQCHFFAGVGVWSLALRRAGWPDDREVWTGSCPCQPFSTAGKGAGVDDERHLWPALFHLITQRQPARIYGEQVASKDGLGWLDLVQADLEGANYSSGAIDLCSAGIGAPHVRQRLWFVAERMVNSEASERWRTGVTIDAGRRAPEAGGSSAVDGVEHTCSQGSQELRWQRNKPKRSAKTSVVSILGDTEGERCGKTRQPGPRHSERSTDAGSKAGPRETNGFWRDADWLHCRDGKWRSVEPGTFPLVDGSPNRVGRLRGYGNAINAEAAKTFIEATI